MLVMIAVALLLLWGAGLYTSHTLGGAIHILLLVAMVFIMVRINQGRKLIAGHTTMSAKMPRR
ncbi:MAG TPA: lmo0937 family membrane protein [Candidatus Angelobacter sp.]|nr:lmo0937 family membrane protein [Candidatus Angelobacter sp.]